MPYYNYGCTHCNYTFELKLPMTDYNLPETAPCPNCEQTGCVAQIIGAPAIGDPIRLGINRPDAGWGDVLKKIKSAHPKGNWDNKKFVPQSGL